MDQARSAEHEGWTSVSRPPRETIQGVWATEDVVPADEDDAHVLKANAEMLNSWTTRARQLGQADHSGVPQAYTGSR